MMKFYKFEVFVLVNRFYMFIIIKFKIAVASKLEHFLLSCKTE